MILVADDDPAPRARVAEDLSRRFGADYEIVAAGSCRDAREELARRRASGDDVAIVLADQWMGDGTGADLLSDVADMHPLAKRGLLVDFGAWGDRPTADAILRAMATGRIDYYVLKPWRSPDELFNRTISEFLHEWTRARGRGPREVTIVGESWSRRAHELRDMLTRNGIPHAFLSAASEEGAELLLRIGHAGGRLPVVTFLDGAVLVDPSATEVARAFGLTTRLDRHDVDVVIVGAGPAGLAAAVYGASEGLDTLVIEREAIGGQAGSSSLIRNYLGFSRGVSGAELAMRAYQQAWVFGATFLMTREVTGLEPGAAPGGRHAVRLADGTEVRAPAVILATGVSYRRLGIPSLEELTGQGVYYGASASEAAGLQGQEVYLVGAGNSAGQAAMHLSRHARRVTMVVRGASLADSMSQYLIDEIAAAPNIRVLLGSRVVGGGGASRLEWLEITDAAGGTERAEAAGLFVMIGARPLTQWLPPSVARDERGFLLTGSEIEDADPPWPLARLPLDLETSVPGVFAAGDVRRRAIKRVASAVGEGAIAIKQVQEHLAARAAEAPLAGPAG